MYLEQWLSGMADKPTVHSGGVASGRVCAQPVEQACFLKKNTHNMH